VNIKKKIVIILITVVVFATLGYCIYLKCQNTNYIPKDYIAIFNGGTGEITYSTYVYKINNEQDNYGFEYINTINKTVPLGSTEQETKITDKGKVAWTDDVLTVAKENNAYSYVTLPNDDKIYSIEEFMKILLMN